MKKIEAIIQPFKLDQVRDALLKADVAGVSVSEVRGVGRQNDHGALFRGAEYATDFVAKTKIEIVVEDGRAVQVIAAIRDAAFTGHVGDGKIFLSPILGAIRIRTREHGNDAV